jgi:hypothetical protein
MIILGLIYDIENEKSIYFPKSQKELNETIKTNIITTKLKEESDHKKSLTTKEGYFNIYK